MKAIENKAQRNLNQVWIQLSREYQTGVIHLMAQLVLKRVAAQIESSGKEGRDEQNPG